MLENVLPKQFWVVLACLRSFLSFLGSFFLMPPAHYTHKKYFWQWMCGPNLKWIGVMVGELSQLVLLINIQKQRIERGLAQENHKTNFLAFRWSNNNENWYNISVKQMLGSSKVRTKIWDFDLVPVCKVNIFCIFHVTLRSTIRLRLPKRTHPKNVR